MQLSLFKDNNRQILLNIADEFLAELDFEQTVPIYRQLLKDYPGDQQITALQNLVSEWTIKFDDPSTDWREPDQLFKLHQMQKDITHSPLRKPIQTFIIESLLSLPEPQGIYRPPDFHIGQLLLEARRLQEASELLQAALLQPDMPVGRLMVWHADALSLLKQPDEAFGWYLSALALDFATVQSDTLTDRSIRNLHISLQVEADGQIPEEQELGWLPVWVILEEQIILPLPEWIMQMLLEGSDLTEKASDTSLPVPTRWLYLLLQAEELRRQQAETSIRAAVRRRMKDLNSFMFSRYLSLIA